MSSLFLCILLCFLTITNAYIPPTMMNESGAYYITSQNNEYQYIEDNHIHCNHSHLCSVECLHQSACSSTKITIESADTFTLKCTATESCSNIQLTNITTNTTTIKCSGSRSCINAEMYLDNTLGTIHMNCTSYESCSRSKVYTGIYSEEINVLCIANSACEWNFWNLSYTKLINFKCAYGQGLGSSACWNIDIYAQHSQNIYLWCDDNMDCISSSLYCPTQMGNTCHLTCNKEYSCRTMTVYAPIDYTVDYLDVVEIEDNALNVVSVSCYNTDDSETLETELVSQTYNNHSILCECPQCCPFGENDTYYSEDECTESDDNDVVADDDKRNASTVGIVLGCVFGGFFVLAVLLIVIQNVSRRPLRSQRVPPVQPAQPVPVTRNTVQPVMQQPVIQQPVMQPMVQYYQPQLPQQQPMVQNVMVNVPQQQSGGGIVMVQLPNGQMVAAQVMGNANQVQPVQNQPGMPPHNEGAVNYTVQ